MIGRLKKKGLRNWQGGVLGARPTWKRGVLGAGQVKTGVFTAANTCIGHICESPHIMLEVGLQKCLGHGLYSWTRVYLFVDKKFLFWDTKWKPSANIIQAFLVTYFNKLVTFWWTLLYDMNYIMNYIWILIIRVWHNEDKAKYLFPEFHQLFSKHHNIGVISSKTRGLLIWRLHCLSLICLFNLVASAKLNNELYNLDYLQCVWSKCLPTWISKNQFVIIVLDISHTNWLELKLC